jgi:hypothetical protein
LHFTTEIIRPSTGEFFMLKNVRSLVVSLAALSLCFLCMNVEAQTVYSGHYVKQYNQPINVSASYFEALVCPTPSPIINAYATGSTGNATLVVYRMTTVPSSWPSANLLFTGKVFYKGFWADFVHVYGARWSDANLVNPSTTYTITVPDSSFVTVSDSSGYGVSNVPVGGRVRSPTFILYVLWERSQPKMSITFAG